MPVPGSVRCYSTFNQFSSDIADCDNEHLHGASVLESVYDIAPDADYYVATLSDSVVFQRELNDIVDWMIVQDVDVIVSSHVAAWSSLGDGTSRHAQSELVILDKAVANGITWISPSGNRAQDTWTGAFSDPDRNGYHNFTEDDECNSVDLSETEHDYTAQIRWDDDWQSAAREMHLELVTEGTVAAVATSTRGALLRNNPIEKIQFTTADTTQSYCLRVQLNTTDDPPVWFNIRSTHRHDLQHATLFGSMTSPAESLNRGMLAVGAAGKDSTDQIRAFSSRGPMNDTDGTIKPDLVGADGEFSSAAESSLQGTEFAAAHVSGLAALVKQRYPNYTPEQVANYLRDNAESRPADADDPHPIAGANNNWGHGFAMLPDDVEGVTPPVQPEPSPEPQPDPPLPSDFDLAALLGADSWRDVGFTGAGVKIGVIDYGFDGLQEHMGTELPTPAGVRCY